MALYRNLLQTRAKRSRAAASKFAAAQVAIEHDLRPEDTVRIAAQSSRRSVQNGALTYNLLDVLGTALCNRIHKSGKVVVVWAAKANPSVLRDALEAARVHKLPILFITETSNNVGSLLNTDVAPGEEMPHILVDGNDVIASYRVAHEAIDRARRDRGPTLIECSSYRVQGQRSGAHLDPVANLETYLRGKGLLPDAAKHALRKTAKASRKART